MSSTIDEIEMKLLPLMAGEFLDPCPFPPCQCTEDDGLYLALGVDGNYFIYCSGCRARGPDAPTRGEAVEAWNIK